MAASSKEEDEALVEHCRAEMQAVIDRIDWDASTATDMLDSAGLPQEGRQVLEADMSLVGRFDIRLPARVVARTPLALLSTATLHFVFRHKDGSVYVLHLPKRLEMRRRGVVTLHAFVQHQN